jgi:tetratricopeptide (TPR) repeat protein
MKIDERELFRSLAMYETDQRKMEYLENLLKKDLPAEIRKLSRQFLADLYKKKKWYNNAAKYYHEVADAAKTFEEKLNFFMLTAEMYVKSNDYFSADDFFRKALVLEKPSKKEELKIKVLSIYLEQAEHFEKINRLRNAMNTYQKILTYNPKLEDANKIRDRIAVIYERLGNLKEANQIRSLKDAAIQAEREKTEQEFKEKAEESISGEKFIDL